MLGQDARSTTPLDLASQAAGASPARQLPEPDAVKAGLTPKPRRQVENDEYAAFVRRILRAYSRRILRAYSRRILRAYSRRILRAYSRRVGDSDVEALALMLGLAEEIDTSIAEAVTGLRARSYSWAEIGSRLGITRQAAHQRCGAS